MTEGFVQQRVSPRVQGHVGPRVVTRVDFARLQESVPLNISYRESKSPWFKHHRHIDLDIKGIEHPLPIQAGRSLGTNNAIELFELDPKQRQLRIVVKRVGNGFDDPRRDAIQGGPKRFVNRHERILKH